MKNKKLNGIWKEINCLFKKVKYKLIFLLKENLLRCEKKKELLLRENEKLKADFKT